MPIKKLFICLLLASTSSIANEWGIKALWGEPNVQPPEIKPYELPTLNGSSPHFNESLPALLPAPQLDGDTIFNTVLRCYPEKIQNRF